jgi:hypothetical protein
LRVRSVLGNVMSLPVPATNRPELAKLTMTDAVPPASPIPEPMLI